MNKILREIKRRERGAYPPHMYTLRSVRTWSDLKEYCESDQVRVELLGEKGYIILTPEEIVDMVVLEPQYIIKALRIIREHFTMYQGPGATIRADCRPNSWRILKRLQESGKVGVTVLSTWDWDGEEMVEVEVTLT